SEMRYTAWGEVRYTWGTTPTDYTYTGQYSNVREFGLMYYNARWLRSVPEAQRKGYDPGLGRFVQADSIVPPGAQGLDRYAYVNNSPVNYTDPSGHFSEDAIKKYITTSCKGDAQCAKQILATWQADQDWWNMLLQAEAGDVLYGVTACCSTDGYAAETVFAYTFDGEGQDVLYGISPISGGMSPNGVTVTLEDIQRSTLTDKDRAAKYYWVGFYRKDETGKPVDWQQKRAGYVVNDFAPQTNVLNQNFSFGVSVVFTVGCMASGGGLYSLACGFAGLVVPEKLADYLNIQPGDFNVTVRGPAGPMYFNFQVQSQSSGKPGVPTGTWTLESLR
ncbi:MAG: RHS repeat-associated core domain-containing protein, partial [Cyclobacteriaceae bacterium]|nr:RHS repeat-associated core domain-containing protein [Cyclobacteriaceae bacterium]